MYTAYRLPERDQLLSHIYKHPHARVSIYRFPSPVGPEGLRYLYNSNNSGVLLVHCVWDSDSKAEPDSKITPNTHINGYTYIEPKILTTKVGSKEDFSLLLCCHAVPGI